MKLGRLIFAGALIALAACAPAPSAPEAEVEVNAPAGAYRLDRSHADLSFRVNHIGMSMYTARFTDFDATLQFNPDDPRQMSVEATINVASLTLPAPPEGFTAEMLGPQWFDVVQFPTITFRSTDVEVTAARTARVTGDLTLHGVTRPVTLDVTFNGGYPGFEMDPGGRVGFSAQGTFLRSDFGISQGIPAPGTTMGVGDEVAFAIEAEFVGATPGAN